MGALVRACFPDVQAPIPLSYFTAGASLALSLVTTLGNLFICLAVIVDPLQKLRTPFSYFLVNLALSDLLAGLIMLPVSVVVHFSEANNHLPQTLLQLLHMCFFISATASVISLAFLLLDRYTAIKWPITYRKRLSMLRCLLISIFIWVFASLISTPYFRIGYIRYLMVFVHTSVAITFIIIVLTYSGVYRLLHSGSRVSRCSRIDSAESSRLKRERRVTRAFLWILILFIMSYTPSIIMIYILEFCQGCPCTLRHVLRDGQFILISSNSSMNPIVCAIRLRVFRKSIVALLKSRGAWRRFLNDEKASKPERSVTQSSIGSTSNGVFLTPQSTRTKDLRRAVQTSSAVRNSSFEQRCPSPKSSPKKHQESTHSGGIFSRTNEAFEYSEGAQTSSSLRIYHDMPAHNESKL